MDSSAPTIKMNATFCLTLKMCTAAAKGTTPLAKLFPSARWKHLLLINAMAKTTTISDRWSPSRVQTHFGCVVGGDGERPAWNSPTADGFIVVTHWNRSRCSRHEADPLFFQLKGIGIICEQGGGRGLISSSIMYTHSPLKVWWTYESPPSFCCCKNKKKK